MVSIQHHSADSGEAFHEANEDEGLEDLEPFQGSPVEMDDLELSSESPTSPGDLVDLGLRYRGYPQMALLNRENDWKMAKIS